MKKYNVNNRRKVALAQRQKDLKACRLFMSQDKPRPDEVKKHKRIVEEIDALNTRIKT
jgi:hypothetical protein